MYYQQPPPKRRSAFRRLLGWCRRHPIWTAVIILVLIIGGAISNATASPAPTSAVATPTAQATTAIVQQAAVPTSVPTQHPAPKPTTHTQVTATPRSQPTPPPAPKPSPTPSCQAVNNNPWCYNFSPGNYITNPPAAFCDYFSCVSTFWTATRGYVAECNNGAYTHSGGVSGACSRDGGVARPLFSH